jgi:hypothetical protein
MATKKPNQHNPYRPNIWWMLQNFLGVLVSKGQLMIMMAGIILIILICKIPPDKATSLVLETIKLIEHWHLLGWILSFILPLCWFFHVRFDRKRYAEEMKRISEEKKQLQEILHNRPMKTSNKQKSK